MFVSGPMDDHEDVTNRHYLLQSRRTTLLLSVIALFVYVPVCVVSLRMFVSVWMWDYVRYIISSDVCFSTELWNTWYIASLLMFVSVPLLWDDGIASLL
mmetsp:Transcript_24317/g.28160  ORF Transcript_24317/g.28160 Transcript_24317/m.28160 type:complete len:99 (+) Transcript_24317:123-419(+)